MQELNIAIKNQYFDDDFANILFSNESFIILDKKTDIYDCLVMLNAFKSKSEARKNWNKTKSIEQGYNEYKNIGKSKKSLYIWNPIKFEEVI